MSYTTYSERWGEYGAAWELNVHRAVSCLKNLDDVSIPVNELRQHLAARYRDRFLVHPRKYEELVGSIFKDFGYEVRVTSYSGDDGIDIFIFDGNSGLIGVQVKRRQHKIQAKSIRELAGALILSGTTKGIFVTTSDYTRGANDTARKYTSRGISITLESATEFYDRLEIANRKTYESIYDPIAPYALC